MRRAVPTLLTLLALLACKKGEAPRETPSATPAPSLSPAPSTSSAPPAPTAQRPAPSIPCKAVEKKKLVSLGAQAGEFGALAVDAGNAYLLTFEPGRAQATLKRLPRNGDKGEVVGVSKSPGRLGGLRVDEEAAYFVHGKALRRLPLAGGEAKTLLDDVIRPIALAEQSLWFVRCNSSEKKDELVSLPRAGGEARVHASWPREGASKQCQYGDLAVTKDDVFLTDWTSRRVLGVRRSDGALRELSAKQPFPTRIAVEPEHIVFQAASGLFRVSKAAGPATHVSKWGSTPFHFFAWDERQFFVFNGEAYGMRHTLLVLPPSGGDGKEIEWFAVADVVAGSGVGDIAVDDACVYLAKAANDYVEVLARPKP